jgi:hypothetical protein
MFKCSNWFVRHDSSSFRRGLTKSKGEKQQTHRSIVLQAQMDRAKARRKSNCQLRWPAISATTIETFAALHINQSQDFQ